MLCLEQRFELYVCQCNRERREAPARSHRTVSRCEPRAAREATRRDRRTRAPLHSHRTDSGVHASAKRLFNAREKSRLVEQYSTVHNSTLYTTDLPCAAGRGVPVEAIDGRQECCVRRVFRACGQRAQAARHCSARRRPTGRGEAPLL